MGLEIRSQANLFMFLLDWKETIRVKNSVCPTKSPTRQNSFDPRKLQYLQNDAREALREGENYNSQPS